MEFALLHQAARGFSPLFPVRRRGLPSFSLYLDSGSAGKELPFPSSFFFPRPFPTCRKINRSSLFPFPLRHEGQAHVFLVERVSVVEGGGYLFSLSTDTHVERRRNVVSRYSPSAVAWGKVATPPKKPPPPPRARARRKSGDIRSSLPPFFLPSQSLITYCRRSLRGTR